MVSTACKLLMLFLLIGIIHVPLLYETFQGESLNAGKAGLYGDFVGGYIGTVILSINIWLLLDQLSKQVKADERFALSDGRNAFESKFFELLRYHRENLNELDVEGKKGRRFFVAVIREFRHGLKILKPLLPGLPQDKIAQVAYLATYYGVGPNSSRLLKEKLLEIVDHQLANKIVDELVEEQSTFRRHMVDRGDRLIIQREDDDVDDPKSIRDRLGFAPFDGHQSRLGHYFRHLFQVVKYADHHAPKNSAYEYVAILRSQMSNHEQALLALNIISPYGKGWRDRGYAAKYNVIRNVPKEFFNPLDEIDLKQLFPDVKFEYEESSN